MQDDTSSAVDDVSIHFLDDAAVLFDRSRQALFSANANAATIWQGLGHKLTPGDVADVLSDSSDLDRVVTRQHVATTLRQWRQWRREVDRADAAARRARTNPWQRLPFQPPAPAASARYRLLDTSFIVRYGEDVPHREIARVLRHLVDDERDGGTERIFDVVGLDGGFAVAEAGGVHHRCETATETAPLVKACMGEVALQDCAALGAIHAAAAERDGTCILLPGGSGAGKSCLSAGLAAEGFTLLGDDTVVLTREAHGLRPLPFGICVKDTAPDALATRFPNLRDEPLHARPDGKRVRYLTPPEVTIAPTDCRAKVSQIVFPRYTPQSGTELIPISDNAALQHLLACFAPLGGMMHPGDVDGLIDWIRETPCYVLNVSSLTESVALLGHFAP